MKSRKQLINTAICVVAGRLKTILNYNIGNG